MGLFNFNKDAGTKIHDEKTEATANEMLLAEKNKKAAAKLEETIKDLKLEVQGLNISINGETATVTGKAIDRKTKEKTILVIGNSKGIASVDDQMEMVNDEPMSKFYSVEKGDSLSKIAKSFYGDPMKYPLIFEANKPMLKDPNKIYPGQVLRIPPVS
ncbi:peptidoglycan-binding protein LysM [Robertkochia solimangrovi]|uniref:peptidoglycan-binding protein LysM n=1 Tax=Robertkochia solimangrovi TaxID=2213046 RepID=UPI00117DCF65|nr:peptidoglycan-binding protein LysM [Robertkochia solimangrovi]TRZ45918.1 peptidoglycan-binding protein LysM [Robertkochia solimangrovi]